MKSIILSILVLTSFACYSQTKDHSGKYRFDSLYSTLTQKGIDTTNFKIVVASQTDGKHFKMYWPVYGSSGITVLKNYVTQTTSTGGGTTDNVTIVNIPANTLSNNGDALEIEVAFTTTGSDTKTNDVVIGSSGGLAASTSVSSAGAWIHKIKLLRTSSTAVIKRSESYLTLTFAGASQGTTGGFDWTTSQDLKVKITSTTAASITINYVTVKVVKE
jgi:hypothetical protein